MAYAWAVVSKWVIDEPANGPFTRNDKLEPKVRFAYPPKRMPTLLGLGRKARGHSVTVRRRDDELGRLERGMQLCECNGTALRTVPEEFED
jgi:hypothetical protein